VSGPVEIVDYDPLWPAVFEALRDRLMAALSNGGGAIEHVGSTAVPGLAAKPILDVDVILRADDDFSAVAARLEALGYLHEGNLGVAGREAFKAPAGSVPQNLYVCLPTGCEHLRHLAFRDYLRSDRAKAAAYADLKKKLASRFRQDRDAYAEGKSEFVRVILEQALKEPKGHLSELRYESEPGFRSLE